MTSFDLEMSKGRGKQVDKDREGASSPGVSVTLAEISALHDDLRASIAVDFKASFESLATKLDNIQSTVADHDLRIGNLESGTMEISQQLERLEVTCSGLQKDNEWLKAKVSDLKSRSRRQNIRILGLPESIEGPHQSTFFSQLLVDVLGPRRPS